MKLFRKSSPAHHSVEPPPIPSSLVVPPKPTICLSAEQKAILEQPVDPRVDRILGEIYGEKAAAERALKSHLRIVKFPDAHSEERHVVQDKNGFWRIVPGPAPNEKSGLFDAL